MRVLVGNLMSSMFALGQFLSAVAAWCWPFWRTYTIIIFYPSFLFVFYYLFVDESMRWLLSHGKKQQAVNIIFKAARINNIQLSPKALSMLVDHKQTVASQTRLPRRVLRRTVRVRVKQPSLCSQVLHSKTIMYRLCVCSFWWVSATLIYYGLSINSVSLGGNKYFNFMLMSAVEIPGFILSVMTLDRFGRKSSLMTSFFLCGISLLAQLLTTDGEILFHYNFAFLIFNFNL